MIEKEDLDELIDLVKVALNIIGDVEGQAALWWSQGSGDLVGALESMANSAHNEVEDVFSDLLLIRKALERAERETSDGS